MLLQVQFASGADSVVQYIYYQPIIHRWRETDFFPCSVTCGGGKHGVALLTSRIKKTVVLKSNIHINENIFD